MFLLAGSTQRLKFTSAAAVDALAVEVVDMMTDETLTLDDPVTDSERRLWTLDLSSASLEPNHTLKVTWTVTIAGQIAKVVELIDALESDPCSPWLVPITALVSHLKMAGEGITHLSDNDYQRLAMFLGAAQSTLDTEFHLPEVPPVSATRFCFAELSIVWPRYCKSVDGVATDTDGTPLIYITEPSSDGSVERIILKQPITGMVAVTGTWGADKLPAGVTLDILITAAAWFRRSEMGDANAYGTLDSVPKEVVQRFSARRGMRI